MTHIAECEKLMSNRRRNHEWLDWQSSHPPETDRSEVTEPEPEEATPPPEIRTPPISEKLVLYAKQFQSTVTMSQGKDIN